MVSIQLEQNLLIEKIRKNRTNFLSGSHSLFWSKKQKSMFYCTKTSERFFKK